MEVNEVVWNDSPFEQVLGIAFTSRGASDDETIWEQMLSKRLDFCKNECESNRVVCILRPKCEDRRYLDVLLLDEKFRKKLPEFCYGTRIDQIIKVDSHDKIPHDIYILTDDLITLLLRKKRKRRPFSTSLLQKTLKHVKKSFYVKEGSFILIEANETWYLVNTSQGLVLVNPQDVMITNIDLFHLLIKFYSEKNGCSAKLIVQGHFIEVIIQSESDSSPFKELSLLPTEVWDHVVAWEDKKVTLEFELPHVKAWRARSSLGEEDMGSTRLTVKLVRQILDPLFK